MSKKQLKAIEAKALSLAESAAEQAKTDKEVYCVAATCICHEDQCRIINMGHYYKMAGLTNQETASTNHYRTA